MCVSHMRQRITVTGTLAVRAVMGCPPFQIPPQVNYPFGRAAAHARVRCACASGRSLKPVIIDQPCEELTLP